MVEMKDKGFTLVEMMMALVVLAVLLAVGVPAFSDLIKNNRMLSYVYELRAALNNARSEALAQRTFVTFCPSSDGASCSGEWRQGFIAFRDVDGDSVVDDPNDIDGDRIFVAKVLDVNTEKFEYSNAADRVRFDSQGHAINFNGTFTICDDRGATRASVVIVTPGGIVRAAEDPNDTGVKEDDGGAALDCT